MSRAFGPDEEEEFRDDKIKRGSKSTTPILDNFGRDLTSLASRGALDPVIGRDIEIDKLVQVLNKRKKNNPILVGEPGTGKTAIVEGLALRVAEKKVDRWMFNKRIIELSISSIVAGTKYRGEFEQRMESILKEAKENPDVIIFIDELHNVVGAGGTSGSMDASNIIKPALSRGDIKVIGATTVDEYKKIIESDSALERRFQKVFVDVPNKAETLQILKQLRDRYESFHRVSYTDEILNDIVEFSDRYINYRNFPDKAIDTMDEVGSRVRLNNSVVPEKIKKLEKELSAVVEKKVSAANGQRYEDAANFRDKEKKILANIEEENIAWEKSVEDNRIAVTTKNIAEMISSHTGIPIDKLTSDENDKLLNMNKELSKVVIGQDKAVNKICEAIQRSRLGIQDPNKPIASFLLLGSTGVGKTHVAKQLAKHMFNSEESFVRFDMSEYMEKFNVTKLIGSPPGYVGHEDRGLLTEAVRNKPYSIILFDEIEKAHPDIFNIFLQILDDGILTDSTGRVINFKNTIIIMTSNIGTDKIMGKKQLGFSLSDNENEDISSVIGEELKKHLRPELINRIDEKIVFNVLSESDIGKIVELELNRVIDRVLDKGYNVSVAKSAKDFLVEVGYEKEYGARPLKRAITSNIENVVAQFILKNKPKDGTKIKLSYDKKLKEIVAKA